MTAPPKATPDEIVKQYRDRLPELERFEAKCRTLLAEILLSSAIKPHSISGRVKSEESLREKVSRPEKPYRNLTDITDLVGLRIIVHYADEVDRAATLIESEFAIDRANSTDKRKTREPDRFGYMSLHHVISLNAHRAGLLEYRAFSSLKAEVQIRSILQHAWAEIEHREYKLAGATQAVPQAVRRRFSRLSGLLELADEEFQRVREELKLYEERVRSDFESDDLDAVAIDYVSIETYEAESPLSRELDDAIARALGPDVRIRRPAFDIRSAESGRAHSLLLLGLSTMGDVERALKKNEAVIIRFARIWLSEPDDADEDDAMGRTYILVGMGLFTLGYVLAAQTGDVVRVTEYIDAASIADPIMSSTDIAARVLEAYRQAVSELAGEPGSLS